MNVRFFAGTRAQYDSLPSPRNPLGLYFCEDTNELFWADRLLTDGMRVIPTAADLPDPVDAADGVVYYVTSTRNGYVVPHGTTKWLQTIYAPALDATDVPEDEIYNTVTTVGAVRDIESKIYGVINKLDERIATIEEVGVSSSAVKAIKFAGVELEEVDGAFVIDRHCAREALGLNVPAGLENAEINIATKEYVDEQLTDLELLNIPTKLSDLENDLKYVTSDITDDHADRINGLEADYIQHSSLLDTLQNQGQAINNELSSLGARIPTNVSELANDAKYITETQASSELVTKDELKEAIDAIETSTVDMSAYALKSEVALKADEVPFTTKKYVTHALGGFTKGESVKDLTMSELFAKLLGLSDMPQGVTEDIVTNKYSLYQFNDAIDVEKVEYKCTVFETVDEYKSAPTESLFYQYTYVDDAGEQVTESAYQHYTVAQDFIYYMVMLPSTLVMGENVKVQVWSPSRNAWMDSLTVFECDPDVIAANFAEVDLVMPVIPDGYTMWVDFSDVNPGNKVRYIIIE